MPTLQVKLTPKLAQLVTRKVASGAYRDSDEVICDALLQLDAQHESMEEKTAAQMKELLRPGLKQAKHGEFVNQTFAEILSEAKRERLEV